MNSEKNQVTSTIPNNGQFLLRYGNHPSGPIISEWLSNQRNKSQSLIFVLEKVIAQYGTDDLIQNMLDDAILFDDDSMVNRGVDNE